jgi:Sigma 54 modulation/S30EA ribosomal protein C terminus
LVVGRPRPVGGEHGFHSSPRAFFLPECSQLPCSHATLIRSPPEPTRVRAGGVDHADDLVARDGVRPPGRQLTEHQVQVGTAYAAGPDADPHLPWSGYRVRQQVNALDYDFHLFTEEGIGQDSVLYRAGPTGYRPELVFAGQVRVMMSEQPAPLLSTGEAVERLNLTGLPFVFYLDADHVRGRVLYRRYDGHYGLITPAS